MAALAVMSKSTSSNPLVLRCGPHCHASKISGEILQDEFHEMFRSSILSDSNKKKLDKKKSKKKKINKGKDKARAKVHSENTENALQQMPFLEIRSNPSLFAVFACVRQCVLDKQIRESAQLFIRSSSNRISDSESDEEDDKFRDCLVKVPKIVGIGLCSVFELIRETRKKHPALCTRSLQALLDMLQGQQPEGLKLEPSDVIDTLFDLLLDIASGQHNAATSSSSSSAEYSYSTSATSLTSYACACLLSLVISRGDTGKLLSAASAMLMSPIPLVSEEIPTPGILTSLQRSVHAVLLGKTHRPEWLSHGIPKSSICDTFKVQIPKCKAGACISSSIVCDGRFLFILSGNTIYKVGSGYAGTIKGQIVMCRGGLRTEDKGWLGYAKGFLYFQPHSLISTELVKIDPDTLKEVEPVQLDAPDCGPSACFSDGEYLGLITAGKDDSFVIRTFKSVISPMPCIHELTLKLARKCMDVFGSGVFDEELTFHSVTLPLNEDEPMSIGCGKDFAILRTMTGKVMFAGKSQSLGIKQSSRSGSKWTELPITKSPKIVHFSVGHEGQHAILLSEDGSAFFVGLARRGEDGDQTKGRRQPKPVKPKKMIKMEGHRITYSACNNGTSGLVTLEGALYLFGKDTAQTDHNSGLVTDLKDIIVTQVALGKAHVVVLTNKGLVYTFGINHKGQCGREYSHSTTMKEVTLPIAMATAPEEEGEDEELEVEEPDVICAPGKHNWKHDQCMVCTLCGECTGYGAGCIASGRPDRNPGLPCGCGAGDSGCAECGCCRMCSRENDQEVELADWSQLAAAGGGVLDNKQSDVIVFDIHYGGRGVARLEDRIRRRMEEYRMIRQRRKQMLQSLKVTLKSSSPSRSIPKDNQDKASVASADDTAGSDHEKETTKLTSLSPGQLFLPFETPVIQIACGMHHTVLLIENGEVYTFGSNQHGQLGLGDFIVRGSPCLVKLPATVTQVAAGSSHTVILTTQGQVYTFGSYQRGQLGRSPLPTVSEETSRKERGKDSTWHAIPGLVPKVGGRNGRRATWVGASGDQTFIKIDESLINSHNLTRANVIANRQCVGIIPNHIDQVSPFRCVMINKVDGTCRSFNSVDQTELNEYATCLDSVYNIVWGYNPSTQEVNRYNIIASEIRPINSNDSPPTTNYALPNMLSPELAVPSNSASSLTRSHAALHLLGCLDLLTQASEQGLLVQNEEEEKQSVNKVYSKEDFSVVNRFESHGGGWGYSGHSIEAIRFMADTDILLGGFGLFGGRGEYTAKIKLLDIGPEGGDQETDGELLAETEEIPYECGPRQKFPLLFDEPVPLQANRWYVTWSRISGPSSDCGSSGQSVVTTEDQVVFYFKSSNKSNNGTDVNAGQLPQLLYRVITPDNRTSMKPSNQAEPICILSREFSRKVSPDCFHSLLKLLRWSWQTFKASICEMSQSGTLPATPAVLDMERLMYISISSLHLLRIYINEIYPNGPISRKNYSESPKLADCIGDARVLLRHILSDQIPLTPAPTRYQQNGSSVLVPVNAAPPILNRMLTTVLEECQQTFLACYHAFYPNAALKWKGLCDLLLTVDVPWVCEAAEGDHLLAAVLASLCSPTIRLTSILPISMDSDSSLPSETLHSPLESNQDGLPLSRTTSGQEMGQSLDTHRYPILVETMTQRTEREGCHSGPYSFKAVLDHLLAAVVRPVRAQLRQEPITHSPKLVASTCALLATIIAELSSQTIGTVLDIQGVGGQVLHVTPSRFARVSQNRTWNTGNGSPDAICFSVDRPGILIKGVTIFGGGGNERHYELELLDDQSVSNNDPSHTQRWKTLEIVRGSFGPDDCYGEVAEIIFQRNIPIKENVKYALRLRNHGDRTNNGDGGLTQVKGPDGTTFTFSDCSLSFNGTNHTRGQISQILYYSRGIPYSTPQDTEIQQSYRDLAELQARRNALSICSTVVRAAAEILMEAQAEEDIEILGSVGSSHLVTMLLPLALAHMGPLATSDPKSAVQVLNMVRDLLPLVAALDKRGLKSFASNRVEEIASSNTTSQQYALVESDHPYRPATVSNYRVAFPSNVHWMALEFDSQCGTAQAEDSLLLYIPAVGSQKGYTFPKAVNIPVSLSSGATNTPAGSTAISPSTPEDDDDYTPYWPVLRKFSGPIDWPHSAIILPGNEVVFSLETASDYVKDEKATFYGFRCQVVGFECPQLGNNLIKQNQNIADISAQLGWEGLAHLERELAYLGGMCAASLMRKDLLLPPESVNEVDEDLEVIEDLAQQVYNAHSQLLCKGFALAHPPSVQQALEGTLPFSSQSNERPFLKDFVACTAGTSGGRLARWLQPEPYVDPKQCELHCSQDELKCGWPAVITVVTKDQYGKVVYSPLLKVEVKAVPLTAYDKDGDANRKLMKVSKPDTGSMTCFGGHPPPNLDTAYEITVKDKMFYYAITMMKELRYVSPTKKRLIENMLVRSNNDGTYVANWTPGSVGWYLLRASIDGFEMGGSQLRSVEVKEPPQGLVLPSKAVTQKSSHQPSKLRKFVVRYSAGLRIRSHPSLQSEQIGVVPVNGTISFMDELHNDDGVWVRLSSETVKKFCHNGYIEAWCLQYNQHLGKTLLVPVEEPKSVLAEFFRDVGHFIKKKPSGEDAKDHRPFHKRGPGTYHVVMCGASGHNIRSRPSLKSPPVGMLVLGNSIGVMEDAVNADGSWVRLDKETMQRYCFNADGEAWSLAQSRSDVVYLQHEAEMMQAGDSDDDQSSSSVPPFSASRGTHENGVGFSVSSGVNSAFSTPNVTVRKGYDFGTVVAPTVPPVFGQSPGQSAPMFTFGSGTSDQEGGSSGTTSPFIFGSPASTPSTSMNTIAESEKTETDKSEKDSLSSSGGRVAALQKWLREESSTKNMDYCRSSLSRDIPAELSGVSVKELVKAIGESRFNGNAATPPQTPPSTPHTPRKSRSISPKPTAASDTNRVRTISLQEGSSPRLGSASSSPVPVPTRHMSIGPTSINHFESPPNSSIPLSASPKNYSPSPRHRVADGWSPVHLPSTASQKGSVSSNSSVRRNSLQSDTSVGSHFSSILRELSQTSATSCIGCITQRNTISPISTPGTPGTPATPGTPKKEVTSVCSTKQVTQTGTQTSPDSNAKGHFSIGAGGAKEEPLRLSPKMARKDRASRQLRNKRDRSHSPHHHHHHHHHHNSAGSGSGHSVPERSASQPSKEKVPKEPVKEAMSPSVAECLRAVFAAFLWHEGLVYDAMACASFLKFNPNVPKNQARIPQKPVVMREKSGSALSMTREQRARLRHSVEVTPGLMNLHPSTIEQIWCTPLNANIIQSKAKKSVSIREERLNDGACIAKTPPKNAVTVIDAEDGVQTCTSTQTSTSSLKFENKQESQNKLEEPKPTLPEKNDQLPQSLQYIVYLWEQISAACLKVIVQQLILPSPANGSRVFHRLDKDKSERDKDRRLKKRKDYRQVVASRSHLFGEASGIAACPERETVCELCGHFFSHPVTYHMRQAHPGCGDEAGGKGYNSSGNYCGGWAGNCGDGGIGGSSWYLVCDACREKYMRQKRQNMLRERAKKSRKKGSSSVSRLLSPLPPMEAHQVMKNNALFLLELSSATRSGLPSNKPLNPGEVNASTALRRSIFGMPSLLEQGDFLENNPFPVGPFQCLDALGVQQEYNNIIGQEYLSEEDIKVLQNGGEASNMTASVDSSMGLASGILRSMTLNGDSNQSPPPNGKVERRKPRMSRDSGSFSGTRSFHRSISVGLTSKEWNKQDGEGLMEGRVIMMRKRNSSGSEEPSSSFLCQPSSVLTKLVNMAMEKPVLDFPLQRPVMIFMLQHHDLDRLQLAMKQALRKAACRVYGMQALNWLIRSVTQPISLHDLLWCFVAALAPSPLERREEESESNLDDDNKEKKDQESLSASQFQDPDLTVCEHPLSEITIAGESVTPLPQTFHALLQTISDLMMLLPVGSALQQMAMKCWCLKFLPEDHSFLHQSHVFSNISKILSRSEEEGDESGNISLDNEKVVSSVEALKDLTSTIEIKASSRQAMVSSLTDNSTETFWESGDDDRNKSKVLSITCGPQAKPKVVYVHIDNCRDLGNKVSSVIFRSGISAEEMQKLKHVDVENRFTGWLSCFIPDNRHNTIKLEMKGPDNTLRLRQVRILGQAGQEPLAVGKIMSANRIQQKNCEAETLKVFRLLTSQVFGKLILGENESNMSNKKDVTEEVGDRPSSSPAILNSEMETSNDLKEHMVGILFSRSKLTHLQKQVCTHIVAAIRKEATRVREEWETLLCSKNGAEVPKSSDAYCFEMLSMVLALSGSSVGRAYLAQQAGLLKDLFSLLHTGSARVQRQVTSLLRRVLPDVTPQMLATILGVIALPPTDFSIHTGISQGAAAVTTSSPSTSSDNSNQQPFDLHKMGILDVFLSCIAKALTVQTKVKGGAPNLGKGVTTVTLATSIHPRDYIGTRWWLRGCMVRKLAEVIIQLLKDMAAGKLSEPWATVTKGAIAENILNLTKLEENLRSPNECLRTPTLWLALASLCVLDQDHVERLSSGQWVGTVDGQQALPRPTCDNHDDGETLAIILCNECGNLCADCDRFLHLHSKTRLHQRQVFKEEEEAIRVDLHEGCGRTKLFWVMALADSKTLKAMVEFREGTRSKTTTTSGVCRFCGATGSSGLLAIGNVCGESECQEHTRNACTKMLNCGHSCGGIRTELSCLPCLHGCGGITSGLKQDADDMCMICFTEALACAPAILLNCGHVFHLHCCRTVLQKQWSGPRITFGFSLCPICKAPMEHPVLKELLDSIRVLYDDVKRKALMRLEYEGLLKSEAVATPGARFYKDPTGFAMERYAYYVCFKCKKAYYGGEARCDIDAGPGEEYDPTELVCGACSDVSRAQMCPKHGTDFLEYKCRYCCSVAVFFCFGTTHFCNACHEDFQRVTNLPKQELPHCPAGPKTKQLETEECPLHVKHPPTGEEFALGCGVCRNAHTF